MGEYEMKKYIYFLFLILFFSCDNDYNKVDDAVVSYWNRHQTEKNIVIDFSKEFDFEWDTLCFYSLGCSLDEINHDLGFQLTEYTDLADRMIFLNHGKLVYIAGWWYNPENPKGIIINSRNNIFKINRSVAKFSIKKKDDVFILQPYLR
ncbi:hypothetical protein [Prevotella koreensis]|uniref:Uncharacterized protein n=1 Tax=Prevotella koreensis TaxID=2490854 RepID=A0A3S0RB97_9BACT|nr:hypothetical protein [Prevotella koreensis]RUL59896.1 hypothetical protein EHV08_09155 [Prevotella koreensis]